MSEPAANAVPNGESKVLTDIKASIEVIRDFLVLVELLDTLPNMKKTPYDVTRSLYQAVSSGRDIETLGRELEGFFGPPKKPAGKPMPVTMRFNPSIKYLHGIREEQALFIRKTRNGFFYGALWPWYKKKDNITVHLGYCGNKMTNKDFEDLEKIVKTKVLNEKVFNELSNAEGAQVQGISLSSFLHMALLEKITCTLAVKTRGATGHLDLNGGELIAAETGSLSGRAAAYEIISWDETDVDIKDLRDKKKNEINQALMDVLTEALRLRRNKKDTDNVAPAATVAPMRLTNGKDRYKALREAQQEPRSKLVPIMGGAVLVVLVVVAGAFFGMRLLKSTQAEREYRAVLQQIETMEDAEDRKVLLQYFIDSHEEGEYRAAAENKIQEIDEQIEEQFFRTVTARVAELPINDQYERAATDIYNEFLERHPESRRANEIQVKIAEIPDLIDDVDYEKVQSATELDYGNRIEAYLEYLVKHPYGRHKTQVEALIADMSEEYYAHLMKEVPRCDKAEKWDRCITLCKNFLSYFKNNHRAYEVENFMLVMEDKRELVDLMERVRQLGDRFEAARDILAAYLDEHPDSSQTDRVKDKLSKVERNLRENREWQNVVSFVEDSHNPLAERISYLGAYVLQNPSGPYTQKANTVLLKLQQENHALYQQRIEDERRRQQAVFQQEKQRLSAERERLITQISQAGTRYRVNGDATFVDSKTGKVWALLDSYAALGNCQDYEAAKAYVKSLKAGGFNDWRLPFVSELAEIYKAEPFFPGSSAPWYWTAEVFSKGYHRKGLIVTSTPETGFKRIQKDLNECGAVRAVRP